jgi:hypothetical protein
MYHRWYLAALIGVGVGDWGDMSCQHECLFVIVMYRVVRVYTPK